MNVDLWIHPDFTIFHFYATAPSSVPLECESLGTQKSLSTPNLPKTDCKYLGGITAPICPKGKWQ